MGEDEGLEGGVSRWFLVGHGWWGGVGLGCFCIVVLNRALLEKRNNREMGEGGVDKNGRLNVRWRERYHLQRV